jgi:hypothetical protein
MSAPSERGATPLQRFVGWGGGVLLLALLAVAPPSLQLTLLALLLAAGAASLAYLKPMWVVYFVTALVPIETVVVKLVPGPDQLALAAQFVGEAAIAGTLLLVLTRRALGSGSWRATPLDLPLLLLIATTLVSLLLNGTDGAGLLAGALNLRVLLRYLGLFYLVVNLAPTPRQVQTIVRIVLALGALNVIVGLLQWGVGEPFRSLFLPNVNDASFLGQTRRSALVGRGREIGAVFGTAGDTLFFGLFLVVVTALFLGTVRRVTLATLLSLGALATAVGMSFARAAVLAWLLVALIAYRWRYGLATALLVALIGGLSLALLLVAATGDDEPFVNPRRGEQSIVQNLTGVFSANYIARARNQRLGHLIGTIPTIVLHRPLFGFGPDQDRTVEALNAATPSFLLFEARSDGFEDVYWMALIAYYGLAGAGAFAAVLLIMARSALRTLRRSTNPQTRGMAITVISLSAATALLMFIYRVPEFRIYATYLWLFPALLYSLDRHDRLAGVQTPEGTAP